MTIDAKAPIYGMKEIKGIHELEPLTSFATRPEGAPGGMLLELNSSTYVPNGWTKIWPISLWTQTNATAFSRVGSTDPETLSVVYLDYLGEELHIVGDPPAEMQTSAFVRIEAGGYAPLGDPTNILSSFTCYVSYDFGQSWGNFFQLNGRFTINGILTDQLAQGFVVSATRLGMRKPTETTGDEGTVPQHSRLVFDNVFFTEYHQLWLEDPNERVVSRGGVGVTPIFERAVEGADDPSERLAVHSGTWGVIRKRNTIVAATFCPVNWCQNSDAVQIPVMESPFCYCVNRPKDIMWIGPMMYLNVSDNPAYYDYFSGVPQEDAIDKYDTVITDEEEYGAGLTGRTAHWRDDGMVVTGSCDGVQVSFYEGWSDNPEGHGFRRAYWDPDFRTQRIQYTYPYRSYVHPTGTTVFILKRDKTEGDVPVWINQINGGQDNIPTLGNVYMAAYHWYDTGGGWFGSYGYKWAYQTIPEPYGTSLWTFAAFKKHMLSLRGMSADVAQSIITEWGGIVRSVIRTPAERDYWNRVPCEIKQRDMCQLGCTIVGEYEINGRYNNMTRALRSEFTYYSASFLKFFVAEEDFGSTDESGNIIFELFQSAQNPSQYGVAIMPSKSFGNVIYGIKSYYELLPESLQRRQCLNYTKPDKVYTYNQEQYGVAKYAPVVSEDGGITWHDVTGLTHWNNSSLQLQYKPIWLGGNQWICEHNSKVYKSFTGIGWSPLEYSPDEEWSEKLDPELEGPKTYPIAVPCRNEWLVVHQYENLQAGVEREKAVILDKWTLRMDRPVISVDGIFVLFNGFERQYQVASLSTTNERTVIKLTEALDTYIYRYENGKTEERLKPGTEVFVSYRSKVDTARLFHVISDGESNLTYIVKDLSFIGDEWFPKVINFGQPYDPSQGWVCAINSLSGGLLSHLYYKDPIISAKANLFPSYWEPLNYVKSELPDLVLGAEYVTRIEVEGGTSQYKFFGLRVPNGISIDPTSGETSGIVATDGDYSFEVVTDDSSTPAYSDPEGEPAATDENPPIYGYVYDGEGKPVEGATVSVVNPQTGLVESTVTTNSHGRYTMNVPANTPKTLRMGKGECQGSDLVQITGGGVARWDGNIGNGTAGTTTMGVGVNQKPPYDQQRSPSDPPTADENYQGTRGANYPVPVKYTDDRPPEFILTTPNFERFVFGEPVTIKLYFSYTDPNTDPDKAPFVTMVYNEDGFPPDLLPTPRPVKLTETQFREAVGTGIANFLMFGWGRFGLEVTVTGTLDANDGNGQPYTQPTAFNIGAIGLLDSKGRSVYSTTITLTGVPLSGEESVPPEVIIDKPANYYEVPLSGKVTIEGSASDDSGLSSLTVGGQSVVVVKGAKRTPFAQELNLQEPGCIKLDVTAIDDSLRKNTTTKSVYVRVGNDPQGPNLTVNTPADTEPVYMFSPTYEFSGSATDSGRGDTGIKQVKVGNQIVDKSSCDGSDTVNWSHKYTGLVIGTNVLTIEAEDNAGNKTTVTRTIVRHEDSVGPNINVTSPNPIDIYSYGSSHTITGTITDSGYGNNGVKRSSINGVDLKQPNGNNATCTGSASVSFEKQVALLMGYNSFNIQAWDDLNNRTEVTVIIRRIEQ